MRGLGFRDHALYKGRQVRPGPSGGGEERAWGERRGSRQVNFALH